MSTHLRGKGLSQATINRQVSSLSSFWDWMGRRGLIDEGVNPWKGQGSDVQRRASGALRAGLDIEKRPFTAEELVSLLSADPIEHSAGKYAAEISDLMRLEAVMNWRRG